MMSYILDAALLFEPIQEHFAGACATYVHDTLHAGNEEYCKLTEEIEHKFECKLKQLDSMQFAKVQNETKSDCIVLSKEVYPQFKNTSIRCKIC